ncbi:MAG: hypothetical protein WCP72_04505 [Desulfomonile sp.]
MKPKLNFTAAVLPFALFVMVCLCCAPSTSHSQDLSSWFSSGTWWDWSDYRFKIEYRYFVPRLVSGSVSQNGTDYDLLASAGADASSGGYNFDPQPTPFNSALLQLQVDRLGLRLRVDEDIIFRGIHNKSVDSNSRKMSELDLSSTRLGLDLDLVRYPFLRCGVDFDYNVNPLTFMDDKPDINTRFYKSASPATLGLHVFAIPARIREVPIIVNAKIGFPFPYWKQITSAQFEVRMLEWEVMAGARPSVWDFSAFGHSTFSVGIEAGFRSVAIDADLSKSASLKAQWQGPFFQFGIYY